MKGSQKKSPSRTAGVPVVPEPQPAWIRIAVLTLAALCLTGLFSTEIADPDFWWHLKTGDYIVQQKSLPVPDPFSYTTDLGQAMYRGEETIRHFNLTQQWLAEAIWSVIHRFTGDAGTVLFKAFLLTGFCALTGLVTARRTAHFYDGLAAALAAAVIASEFSVDRPVLITFFLTALFIAILEAGRGLWLLPALSLFWANCHGGFFLSWVVLGAYSAQILVGAWMRRRDRTGNRGPWLETAELRVLGIALLSFALSGLNPNYFRIIEVLRLYRQSQLISAVIEWQRPSLWGPPYAFDILLYAAGIVLMIWWRKVRVVDWLLFAAFGMAALLSFRNIILIALLAPVIILSYVPFRPKIRGAGYATIAILAAWLGTGVVRGDFYQLRAAHWRYPAGASEFLLSHPFRGRLFNTWDYGGYLIWSLWPQQKVFIDGRVLNESVNQDYRRMLLNPGAPLTEFGTLRQTLFNRYQVGAMVLNGFEYSTGTFYPLALALANPSQTEYQLVYEDPQAMVFLRDPPPDIPVLGRERILDHLEAECKLHLEKAPEFPLCARTLGYVFMRAGDTERARRALGLYLAHPGVSDTEAVRAFRQTLR
jgi:hypothetical protein